MGKAIIDDVATMAGVSIKTVSRVMNKEPNVREITKKKVEAAAKALNYRPSRAARGLASNSSYLLALLYNNPSPSYLTQIQSGVLKACEENHYGMVLRPAYEIGEGLVEQVVATIEQSRVDGFILTPPICDDEALLNYMRDHKIPYVAVSPPDTSLGLSVTIDEQRAAREMTDYLIGLGHERIGFIKGDPSHGASRRRFDGYCEALKDAGIEFEEELIADGKFTFECGIAAADNFFKLAKPITAVFASNDYMAAGIVQVALNRGIKIPENLSIVGFDNTPISRQIWPTLTTVNQPIHQMGYTAACSLLNHLGENLPHENTELPFEIIYRDSSSKPVS